MRSFGISDKGLRRIARAVKGQSELDGGEIAEQVTEYVVQGVDGILHPTSELIEKLSAIADFEELRLFMLDEVNPYVPWLSSGLKSPWDRVRELSQAGYSDWAAVYQAYIDTYEYLMSNHRERNPERKFLR